MAAFTSFEEEALDQYLEMFGKGRLASFSPIAGGIENSNYFVHLENEIMPDLTFILFSSSNSRSVFCEKVFLSHLDQKFYFLD